jgi:hypothetical protein
LLDSDLRALSSSDAVQAHHFYDEFLALWKDADPDIPILRQAKLESKAVR